MPPPFPKALTLCHSLPLSTWTSSPPLSTWTTSITLWATSTILLHLLTWTPYPSLPTWTTYTTLLSLSLSLSQSEPLPCLSKSLISILGLRPTHFHLLPRHRQLSNLNLEPILWLETPLVPDSQVLLQIPSWGPPEDLLYSDVGLETKLYYTCNVPLAAPHLSTYQVDYTTGVELICT